MSREQNAYILFMSIEILIDTSNSLKSKRRVIRSITDRLRQKFNLSLAEIDYLDRWQRSVIGLSMVSNDKRLLHQSAAAIENFMREFPNIELSTINVDIF